MDLRSASRLFPLILVAALATGCGAGATVSPSVAPGESASAAPSQASTAPSDSPAASQGPATSQDPAESLAPYACTLPIHSAATIHRAQISNVAVGAHDAYDRIVFTFTAGLPEVTVERTQPPFTQDASGLPISLQGTSFLKITMHGGTTVLPDGGRSYPGKVDFSPRFTTLTELKSGGDFEAVASWYVGMSREACVRAFALAGPSRLVIDLQH